MRWIPLLLLFASCSSIEKSHMNASLDMSVEAPMRAKVDVDLTRKLVGYASGGYLFHLFRVSGDSKYADDVRFNGKTPGLFSFLSKVNAVKAAAAYNSISSSNADVLVNPQYVVEEGHWNPFYKLIKVKVTGFAGRIVSIKNK